jgi:hypothetical protein
MPRKAARIRRIGTPWWGKVSQSCDRASTRGCYVSRCERGVAPAAGTLDRTPAPGAGPARSRSRLRVRHDGSPLVRSLMDAREAHGKAGARRPRRNDCAVLRRRPSKLGLVLLDQQVISKKRERSAAWHSFSPSECLNGKRNLIGRCVADGRSSDDGCDGDFHVQVALSRRSANRGRKNGSRCCSTRPARRGCGSSFDRSRQAPLTSGRKSEGEHRQERARPRMFGNYTE